MKRTSVFFALAAVVLLGATSLRGQVVFRGDVDFWTYGSRVRIEADDLTNFGDTRTEMLRVRLWASEDRWQEFDRGRVLAAGLLIRMQPHQNLSDFHRTLRLFRPPTGWYYVTLTLEERVPAPEGGRRWEIRDIIEFDGRHYFVKHRFNPFWPF